MDNVTHTLIGVAVGKASGGPATSRAAVVAAVVASNLPDADFVAPLFLGGGNLTYVLHHRGWTHTLVFAPVVIALSAAIARSWARPTLAAAAIAWVLHVAFDGLNNYGVHPFSPFSDRWLYGDTLFIVEPLLWFALLPHVFDGASRRWKAAGGVIAALGLLATAFGPFGSLLVALAVALWGGAMVVIRSRPAFVTAACLLVIAAFAIGARLTRREAAAALPPDERVLDVMVRPAPANPFCWDLVARSEAPDGILVARVGRAGSCESILGETRSVPLVPSSAASTERIRWIGEWRTTPAALAAVAQDSCRFLALLRFARAPFFTERIAGDLRFDFSPAMDFAEVELDGECPRGVPHWVPPAR